MVRGRRCFVRGGIGDGHVSTAAAVVVTVTPDNQEAVVGRVQRSDALDGKEQRI